MNKNKIYCGSLTKYSRFKTREVFIGDIPLGGGNPIRIQSMTTADTMNTIATVEQTIRMVNAGCDYVRITAPSINEAENLADIKAELRKRGYNVPLIADIHFTPNAAETAARIVEKVRINPGNYIDRKKFNQIEYTDSEYQAEIERIRRRFSPLVKICREYGTAMRIGTNHGSLSDRILSRYGDTPIGMVESALEFLRICEDLDYRNCVLSMKSSNTRVMVQAYRLLVNRMIAEGMNYPLHLGVTEAGGGEDGRIKSALGIGTLLEDGLGDTIRVSLTEEPEREPPVAIALADRYKFRAGHGEIPETDGGTKNPFEYERRKSARVLNIGADYPPVVIADLSKFTSIGFDEINSAGYFYDKDSDKWNNSETAADYIFTGKTIPKTDFPLSVKIICDSEIWQANADKANIFPLFKFDDYFSDIPKSHIANFISISIDNVFDGRIENFSGDKTAVFVLETSNKHGMAEQRRAMIELDNRKLYVPAILKRNYKNIDSEKFQLYASTDFGGLLIDGCGDGIWASAELTDLPLGESTYRINRINFGILQAARVRISKTEFIACPSCGRTLFDLAQVTNKIRSRTEHLKGLKIGIMGCIVNGPGEMADADYGYVGSGPGKITLYRGREIIERSIHSGIAVDRLIEIIKQDGNWVEPK